MAKELVQVIDQLLPFNDIGAKQAVEIAIHQKGLVIWINIDGVCIARIMTNGMIPITIEDNRTACSKPWIDET